MAGKLNIAVMNQGLHMQCQRKQCLMDIQSEAETLLRKSKDPLTVSDDQLPVGGKWENMEFSFPPISIKPFPLPFP